VKVGFSSKWMHERCTGVGRYCHFLLRAVLDADQENQYIFLQPSGLGKVEGFEEVPIRKFPSAPGPSWILGANLFFSLQGDLDVIHEPYLGVLVPTPSARVITVHDLNPLLFEHAHPSFSMYFRLALCRAVRNADAVITVSENTRKDLVRICRIQPSKVFVTHLGPACEIAENTRPPMDRPYLLCVGTILPIKNHITAIKALSILRQRGVDLDLVIVGKKDFHYSHLLSQVDELGLKGHVHFPGTVSDAEVSACYRHAVALLFPSLYEGFGLPVLEAMRHGTPVVASRASSIPEVLGDAGILLEPDAPEMWAEAVESLMDPSVREEYSQKGLERSAAFTWESCARKTLEVYKKVSSK